MTKAELAQKDHQLIFAPVPSQPFFLEEKYDDLLKMRNAAPKLWKYAKKKNSAKKNVLSQ